MKKTIRAILYILLAIIILICGGIALRDFTRYRKAKQEYDSIDQKFIQEEDQAESEKTNDEEKKKLPYPNLTIDYDGLLAVNPDFVGVLYVPGLDIRYPVAKSHDDAEYLYKTFEGKPLFAGCIFMEMDSKSDFSGWNTFIYGHNMNNGSMFGPLKKYLRTPGLCDEDPYFYIYTKGRVFEYRIFAYHTTAFGGDLYRYAETEEEYDSILSQIRKESVYENGKDIDMGGRPRIVTLSTCYATGHIKAFVVHGALTGEYTSWN